MIPETSTVLFVYGTFAPGEDNAHIMDGMQGEWCTAYVRGKHYNKGWGIKNGHPGLIPDKNGGAVNGLVFISNELPANWAKLDEFEGVDYKRVAIKATLEKGEFVTAQAYRVV